MTKHTTNNAVARNLEEIDAHILDLRKHCLHTADMIREVISIKPHVTNEMRARYDADYPEFVEIVNKAPLWDGHLTRIVKNPLDDALMKATQIDSKPSTPMANAYYGGQVTKVLRMIIEAEYVPDVDEALRRLPMDDIRGLCPMAGCGKFRLYRDKHGNVPAGRKKADVCYKHSRAKAAQAMALQAHRKEKAASRAKAARRKTKEARKNPKPDPEYVKDMEARKKKLREGWPSREERRKSRGF